MKYKWGFLILFLGAMGFTAWSVFNLQHKLVKELRGGDILKLGPTAKVSLGPPGRATVYGGLDLELGNLILSITEGQVIVDFDIGDIFLGQGIRGISLDNPSMLVKTKSITKKPSATRNRTWSSPNQQHFLRITQGRIKILSTDSQAATELVGINLELELFYDESSYRSAKGSLEVDEFRTIPRRLEATSIKGDLEIEGEKVSLVGGYESLSEAEYGLDLVVDTSSPPAFRSVFTGQNLAVGRAKQDSGRGLVKFRADLEGSPADTRLVQGRVRVEFSPGEIQNIPITRELGRRSGADGLIGREYEGFIVEFKLQNRAYSLKPFEVRIAGGIAVCVSGRMEPNLRTAIELDTQILMPVDQVSTTKIPRALIKKLPELDGRIMIPVRILGSWNVPRFQLSLAGWEKTFNPREYRCNKGTS